MSLPKNRQSSGRVRHKVTCSDGRLTMRAISSRRSTLPELATPCQRCTNAPKSRDSPRSRLVRWRDWVSIGPEAAPNFSILQ
jgi:hypothetical protein